MRRVVRLFVGMAVALTLLVAPGTPAHADTETCAGVGTFNLLNGEMTYTTTSTRTFEVFMPSIGRCINGPEFWFGSITGTCGAATGWGYANARPDHVFSIVWAGTELLMFSPTAGGVMTLAPNPFVDSNDCIDGGRSWIGPGVLTLQHPPV